MPLASPNSLSRQCLIRYHYLSNCLGAIGILSNVNALKKNKQPLENYGEPTVCPALCQGPLHVNGGVTNSTCWHIAQGKVKPYDPNE